jgi:hypothetical protein
VFCKSSNLNVETCNNKIKFNKTSIVILLLYNLIGSVMVSVFTSSVVDRGFIGSVMVSVLTSSVVDRGFIGSVMVSVPHWR